MNYRPASLARLILLAFLFAVQSMSFAHEIDHLSSGDKGTCTVCIAGGSLGHAVLDSAPELPETSCRPVFEPGAVESIRDRSLPIRRARAPPLS